MEETRFALQEGDLVCVVSSEDGHTWSLSLHRRNEHLKTYLIEGGQIVAEAFAKGVLISRRDAEELC